MNIYALSICIQPWIHKTFEESYTLVQNMQSLQKNHPRGEFGSDLVYPVFSRRSKGLSVGINLFPTIKTCNFNCPYCEVHPFHNDAIFSLEQLEADLIEFFQNQACGRFAAIPVRDICISGNGEPTLSPYFASTLDVCAKIRTAFPENAGKADLVLITNGTGFLDESIAAVLHKAVSRDNLQIWAKLDAGSQDLFYAISRSGFRLEAIVKAMTAFARRSPLTIQSMLCRLGECEPTTEDARRYAATISAMADAGAKIQAIQFYTVARTPLEPSVGPLTSQQLRAHIKHILPRIPSAIPVRVYDETSEIRMDTE